MTAVIVGCFSQWRNTKGITARMAVGLAVMGSSGGAHPLAGSIWGRGADLRRRASKKDQSGKSEDRASDPIDAGESGF
jgi:hypothetical protein